MPDIALLNGELDDIVAKRSVLREKHRGATMPEEARSEDQDLFVRGQKIKFLIEEEGQKARDAGFAELADWMNKPQYQIARAVNADDEGKNILARAGWEINGEYIQRQTSLGKMFDMYPTEVLFGAIPSGPKDESIAKYYAQTRAIFQPEYRNAWVKWFRMRGASDSMAFTMLTSAEQNALSEGRDDAGGFMAPPDLQAEIFVRLPQTSVMNRICRTVMTARDSIRFPAIAPNATNGSIYSSGFTGSMVGETPAFTDTDPAFQAFEIAIKKGRVATKLSNDWLSDAAANMLAFLAQNGAQNMALLEDSEFIGGIGSGIHVRGLLNSGISEVDVEGSTTNTISNTTSNSGTYSKIESNLIYGVPSQYVENASFLMTRSSEGKTRALIDGNGRPMWLGANDSGFGATPRNIQGYPLYNSEFMEQDGTDGNRVYAYGDFQNYIIGRRAELSTVVLRERFADNDQTGIIIFSRFGGGCWNTDALRLGKV